MGNIIKSELMDRQALEKVGIFELREIARDLGVKSPSSIKKGLLIDEILKIASGKAQPNPRSKRGRPLKQSYLLGRGVMGDNIQTNYILNEPRANYGVQDNGETEIEDIHLYGIADIQAGEYAILRQDNYRRIIGDPCLPLGMIRKYGIKSGDAINATAVSINGVRSQALVSVEKINGIPVNQVGHRVNFDDLLPLYPQSVFMLAKQDSEDMDIRCMQTFLPIGKGQRCLIECVKNTNKSAFAIKLANAISANNDNARVYYVMTGKRPEDIGEAVQELNSNIIPVYTTFAQGAIEQASVASLGLENAKRNAELGCDCVIILDSLNALCRAYALSNAENAEKQGIENAIKYFSCAGNLDGNGSLTMVAFADDLDILAGVNVVKAFDGMQNMRVVVNDKSKKNMCGIDIEQSSIEKAHKFVSGKQLEFLERVVPAVKDGSVPKSDVMKYFANTSSNEEFIEVCLAKY